MPERPTVHQSDQMGFGLAAVDIDSHPDQGIHRDVVDSPLQVQLKVLSLVAEEIACLIYYDPYLFRQPSGGSP